MWMWILIVACEQPVAELSEPTVPPAEHLAAIDANLAAARDLWFGARKRRVLSDALQRRIHTGGRSFLRRRGDDMCARGAKIACL